MELKIGVRFRRHLSLQEVLNRGDAGLEDRQLEPELWRFNLDLLVVSGERALHPVNPITSVLGPSVLARQRRRQLLPGPHPLSRTPFVSATAVAL